MEEIIQTINDHLIYDHRTGLRLTAKYGCKEFHFQKGNATYYICNRKGKWELFQYRIVKLTYGELDEHYKRVCKGTDKLCESIEMFNQYLGGKR